MGMKRKFSEKDVAVASSSGHPQSLKCLYCFITPMEQNLRPIKRYTQSDYKFICAACARSEKFTVATLIDVMKEVAVLEVKSISKMGYFNQLNIPDCGMYTTLGFLDLGECTVCQFKYTNEASVKEHWADVHPAGRKLFRKCKVGCGGYYKYRKQHEASCKIICPYKSCEGKKKKKKSNDHFKTAHPIMVCPIMFCPAAFKLGDVEGLCQHILTTDLYRFLSRKPFVIPSEYQKEQCYFCDEEKEKTEVSLIRMKNEKYTDGEKIYICLGCEQKEKFPIATLKEMLEYVGSTPMDDIRFLKKFIIPKDFDSTDAIMGFLELNRCRYCHKFIKRNQTFEAHKRQEHSGKSLAKCESQSFQMSKRLKRCEDDGAVASTSGQTSIGLCLYCRAHTEKPITIRKGHQPTFKFICAECVTKEKLTVGKLIDVIKDVAAVGDVQSFRKMIIFEYYKIPQFSDETDVMLGFLDFAHFWNKHSEKSAEYANCEIGCGGFFKHIKKHHKGCGIICPYYNSCKDSKEKKKLNWNDAHFNAHKIMVCPIMSCPKAFVQGDVGGLCCHILLIHLYRFEDGQFDKQTNILIKQKCHYCDEDRSDVKLILRRKKATKLKKYICSGCEEKERFPIFQLKEMLKGVGSMPMDDIVLLKEKIPEEFDVTDAPFGFLDLNKCRYCYMSIKRNQTFEEHKQREHPAGTFLECERCCLCFNSEHALGTHVGTCERIQCPYEQQSFKMSQEQKRCEDDGAAASTSGGNQKPQQCLYCCDKPETLTLIWNGSLHKTICAKCEETEKFTFAALINEMRKVADIDDVESIKKMDELSQYKIPENSDGTDILLGFLYSGCCSRCKFHYRNDEASVIDHWNNNHSHEMRSQIFEKCKIGCGGVFRVKQNHNRSCGIICPYHTFCEDSKDELKLDRRWNDAHFKEHKIMVCPIMACPTAFKKGDIQSLCKHFFLLHLYRFDRDIDIVVEHECHYCGEVYTNTKLIWRRRKTTTLKRYICSGCEENEKFPILQLREMLKDVGSMPMEDIVLLKEKIPEGFVVTADTPFGFLDINKCRYCYKFLKRGQPVEQHKQNQHSKYTFFECKQREV
ncbi:Hypothetical predicted protein [Cloeon dipterum]|uniref:C2H2-type domain-containing protein n=1 Tax=Cloeon dipterum TaxID=197152 RepID=A0A8S1DEV9_9INSE|nr:Hypothetical predicted protein [Cloeon dipterum]